MAILYKVASGQPAFTVATRVAGPVPAYPFPKDLTAVTYTETWWQLRSDYTPLALDLAHPTLAGARHVGEIGHRDVGGGLMEWQRLYSTIPAARTEPGGTYAYAYPAFPTGAALDAAKTITGLSPSSGAASYLLAPVFTVAAHGYLVGDRVTIALTYSGGSTGGTVAVTAVTTNTFTTGTLLLYVNRGPGAPGLGTFVTGTVRKVVVGRNARRTIPAGSYRLFDYALPGITAGVSTAADFRAAEVFQPLDASGNEVDTLDGGTTPTDTDYRAMIASGTLVVVESTVETYLGNILQRSTLAVPAK